MRVAAALGLSGRRVERQPALHQRVQQDAERPGVRVAAVVGLAEQDLGRRVVFAAAAGGEEGGLGGVGDAAAEAEVGESE